jgi:hypothetical protein
MIEVWPDVQSVTLSAYFLDFAYEKNRNRCHATKRVFDRDQEARARSESKKVIKLPAVYDVEQCS